MPATTTDHGTHGVNTINTLMIALLLTITGNEIDETVDTSLEAPDDAMKHWLLGSCQLITFSKKVS